MLLELCEYLLTPAPALARASGLLKEAVAIRARHARCRQAWAPHLERCRAFILRCARLVPQGGTAVVLGSGALLDVPVTALAEQFAHVVLVDMVHPLGARWRVRGLRNVRLAHHDVGGALAPALAGRQPDEQELRGFGAVLQAAAPAFVVSVNILSQLPLLPQELLGRAAPTDLGARMVRAHLDLLAACGAPTCLITDTFRSDGSQNADLLHGVPLPAPALDTWTWDIAPRPEVAPDRDHRHQVTGMLLPTTRR